MHLQPIFENCPFYGDGTAEKLFEQGLCLPSGSNLTDADMTRIFKIIDQVWQKAEVKV
jgi:dTDP-4-amino-4,6-dideoxygalactose transaminase